MDRRSVEVVRLVVELVAGVQAHSRRGLLREPRILVAVGAVQGSSSHSTLQELAAREL